MSFSEFVTKDFNISLDNYTKLDKDRRNLEVSEYSELSILEGMSNILQNNMKTPTQKLHN